MSGAAALRERRVLGDSAISAFPVLEVPIERRQRPHDRPSVVYMFQQGSSPICFTALAGKADAIAVLNNELGPVMMGPPVPCGGILKSAGEAA